MPLIGAVPALSRGRNSSGSEAPSVSSCVKLVDHFARSLMNDDTSASRSGERAFEVLSFDPKLAILALTTALVCGNPSSSMYLASLFSWVMSLIALMSSKPTSSNLRRSSSLKRIEERAIVLYRSAPTVE